MTNVDSFLAHYGVPGMRWGVKKGIGSPSAARTNKELKVRAKRKDARRRRQVLSDKDLDQLVNRLQKEKKLKELLDEDLSPGRTMSKKVLVSATGVVAGGLIAGGMKAGIRAAMMRGIDVKDAASFIVPLPKKK